VRVSGAYTGSENDQYSFYAVGDGQVGVTAGLTVSVYDRAGTLVATLDVGDNYEPGTDLEVGNGVKVSFGPGRIQSSTGQAFALDTLADSDTSDILVALGINSFFQGSGAADIAVNPELRANVDALAAGIGSAEGDAGNLVRLLDLRESEVDDLDANTIEDFWADVIGDVGFETAGAEDTLAAQDLLLQRLEAERESVSGVNLDEEMLDMVRFQQSFDAAARFLSTVQELTDTLINLGR
jgi:flagellar hook-associated protein 1 FlgK